jgi:hypothetical protein
MTMLPLLALSGASQIADAVTTGLSSLSQLLSSKPKPGDDSGKAASGGTSDPTSFASMLAAQGVGTAAPGASTPAVGGGGIPAQPHLSPAAAALSAGNGHAGAASHRVGHLG